MFIGWSATTIMIQGILVTTYFPSILLISPSIYFIYLTGYFGDNLLYPLQTKFGGGI